MDTAMLGPMADMCTMDVLLTAVFHALSCCSCRAQPLPYIRPVEYDARVQQAAVPLLPSGPRDRPGWTEDDYVMRMHREMWTAKAHLAWAERERIHAVEYPHEPLVRITQVPDAARESVKQWAENMAARHTARSTDSMRQELLLHEQAIMNIKAADTAAARHHRLDNFRFGMQLLHLSHTVSPCIDGLGLHALHGFAKTLRLPCSRVLHECSCPCAPQSAAPTIQCHCPHPAAR